MASIYLPVIRAFDSNGDPVSGAGLWIYETGTTTAVDLFTDDGLTIPAANPLTANSAGYFPQVFVAASTTVDLQCRASAASDTSTLLWQALEIDSLGAEDLSTFFRDFGNSGRVQFVARNDMVNLEFGDPAEDDIGGTARIGGWNDTQGNDLELDFAEINFPKTALGAVTAFQTLTDGATINWDAVYGFNAKVTLGGNRTLAAPTNLKDGYTYTLAIIQDGVGSRTLTWDAIYEWGNVGTPALSTTAGKVDFAFGVYFAETNKVHMSFRKAAP